MDQQLQAMFLTTLEQNQHRLLRICSVYAEDAEDRKDLFQESVINIWQSMPSFEARSSLSTWMYRVTLNVCLRLHTKQAKKKQRFQRLDSISIENMKIADETSQEEADQLAKLRSCIAQLADGDKAITTLYLEGLAYKEIANITGLTENHVAVKVKRIKAKLLGCITEKS